MQDLNAPANPLENLAYIISQQIEDHSIVYIGTGIPMVAGILAKKTHAPTSHWFMNQADRIRLREICPGRWDVLLPGVNRRPLWKWPILLRNATMVTWILVFSGLHRWICMEM